MTLTSESSLEETLNAYIADEYFASLQYRMAKVVAKGKALEYSNNIFGDNGDEEDEHFDEIVEYAQSLGIPVKVNPKEMEQNCTTPFVELHDGDTTAQLVSILISAEKKAIEGYETGLRNTNIINEHPELTQFFGELLNDERGHLKELEDLESNIAADGKTVPQASSDDDDGTDGAETDSSDDGNKEVINGSEDEESEDDDTDEANESVEEDGIPENTASNELIRRAELGDIDAEDVVKNLIQFLSEDCISDFADYKEHFNSDLARDTSQYEENQCKNKFLEMIDDGMVDAMDVLKDLVDFVRDDVIEEFSKDLGYSVGESVEKNQEVVDIHSISESTLSFSSLFKRIRG